MLFGADGVGMADSNLYRDCGIRWLIRKDMSGVLLADSFVSEPWDEETFISHLQQRNMIGKVVECGEEICGYMLYRLHKKYLELVRIGVHAAYRRRGFGTKLIDHLKFKLGSDRVSILINVPEEELALQLMLRSCGFFAYKMYDGEICMEYWK